MQKYKENIEKDTYAIAFISIQVQVKGSPERFE